MIPLLRLLFFSLIVRPLVLILLGLNVRHRERLPHVGPAIIVANHNSHLDALVLISLFPLRVLKNVRPVAARDYFFRNRCLKWFSLNVIGVIPLQRQVRGSREHPLQPIEDALEQQQIVILFPEGSRGEPEQLADFKSGVAHLAQRNPAVPLVPIYLHGLGKALPRGEALLVPFFCDLFIGDRFYWNGERTEFMHELTVRMTGLAQEGNFAPWV